MAESQVHASIPERKRCAVYTRVSVDDARHEPFGSTDAQFMACHELIASQQGLGWQPSSRLYEHRGYSASHLRRPGIQMLLDDVQSGLVDVVVVHRLDRLTRHVGDMQTLMSVFEQHGVALVCVTLSLDTSSSHVRLALHLWTSFAQFERELIGGANPRQACRRQAPRPVARQRRTLGLCPRAAALGDRTPRGVDRARYVHTLRGAKLCHNVAARAG